MTNRLVSGTISNFYLLDDLEDSIRMNGLAERDRNALHAVADWIWSFVTKPHKDLGRPGPVCPFVPAALERKTLWLAPERVADVNSRTFADLMQGYKRMFMDLRPGDGEDTSYKSLVVVLADLPADRAKAFFDSVLQQLAVPTYAQDGLVLGPFYERNAGSAIYNPDFRPFAPPVPFLLVRHAVISDWKFFLDDAGWLDLWARRYGLTAVQALAEELRRLPWRAARKEAAHHATLDAAVLPGR